MSYYPGHAIDECPYCGEKVVSIAMHLFVCPEMLKELKDDTKDSDT